MSYRPTCDLIRPMWCTYHERQSGGSTFSPEPTPTMHISPYKHRVRTLRSWMR